MALITCGLTAEDWEQLQNPTIDFSLGLRFTVLRVAVLLLEVRDFLSYHASR